MGNFDFSVEVVTENENFWGNFWMVGTIYILYMFGRLNLTYLDLRSPKAL